jgi:ribosomal protein S18 acetylase RimI-like enzyme
MDLYTQGSKCLVALRSDLLHSDSQRITNKVFGNLLGTVEFSPNDFKDTAFEYVGSERKLYVADLAIREDARRLGIATKLLHAVESYAAMNLYDEIYLHVEICNQGALKLYGKNGYSRVPPDEKVLKFTEDRLHKAHDCYVLLRKKIEVDAPVSVSAYDQLITERVVEGALDSPCGDVDTNEAQQLQQNEQKQRPVVFEGNYSDVVIDANCC